MKIKTEEFAELLNSGLSMEEMIETISKYERLACIETRRAYNVFHDNTDIVDESIELQEKRLSMSSGAFSPFDPDYKRNQIVHHEMSSILHKIVENLSEIEYSIRLINISQDDKFVDSGTIIYGSRGAVANSGYGNPASIINAKDVINDEENRQLEMITSSANEARDIIARRFESE